MSIMQNPKHQMLLTEKFLDIIQTYPILYDSLHKDYRNTRKKDKVWDKIGLELNEHSNILRKKWKNLKDGYSRYIKTQNTEMSESDNSIKKWVWAEKMSFFKPFFGGYTRRSRYFANLKPKEDSNSYVENNSGTEDEEENYVENEDIDEFCFVNSGPETLNCEQSEILDCEQSESFNCEQSETLDCEQSEILNCEQSPTSEASSISGSKKMKRNIPSPCSDMEHVMNYFGMTEENPEDNEIESLMLAYAKTIKKFSKRRQIITKIKIAELIMDQELINLQETNLRSKKHKKN